MEADTSFPTMAGAVSSQMRGGIRKRDILAERAELDRAIAGQTLCTALARIAELRGDEEALTWKAAGREVLTWRRHREQVRDFALGLRALGVAPGSFGVILTRNRPEHVIASHGLVHALGTPVGLYPALAPEQVAYIADHCAARVAVVEAAFLPMLRALRPALPTLEWVVVVGESEGGLRDGVIGWEELLKRGHEAHQRSPHAFEEATRQVTPDDLAAVVYTSGTSGPPKGVMLTHRDALRQVENWRRLSGAFEAGGRLICYAALAHVGEHWLTLWTGPVCGTVTHLCPGPAELLPALREVRPTWFFGPPRIWEQLHARITTALDAQPDSWPGAQDALRVGRAVVACRQRGEPVPRTLAREHSALGPQRAALLRMVGLDRCRVALIGSAPCPPALTAFFHALGLPLTEAWGMTETVGPVLWTGLDRLTIGSVGRPMRGVEARLAPDGELLVRGGPMMAGYYKDQARTADAIDRQGWLHTGDIAEVDETGCYRIIDRKKDLIITSFGKNISPSNLEHLLTEHVLIGQACVVGDRRDRLTALLVLDPQGVAGFAQRRGLSSASSVELATHPSVRAEIQRHVDAVNERLSGAEQITAFTILLTEWSVAGGELTPTLKLKRFVIARKYADAIEAMYS